MARLPRGAGQTDRSGGGAVLTRYTLRIVHAATGREIHTVTGIPARTIDQERAAIKATLNPNYKVIEQKED